MCDTGELDVFYMTARQSGPLKTYTALSYVIDMHVQTTNVLNSALTASLMSQNCEQNADRS